MKENYKQFGGFPRKPATNFWSYPKALNGWWHILTGSEQKVLDYILRHTWGYNKTSDFISMRQFSDGIRTKAGRQVDNGCGIKHRRTLKKAMNGLVSKGFINATKNDGKTTNFQLRWAKDEPPVQEVNGSSSESEQVAGSPPEPTIEDITIKNKTIIDIAKQPEVNSLISLFKTVNPSYKQLFGNKTQRLALERLLQEHGREKLEKIISILPEISGMQYAPVITTPLELENKLGKLITFIKKEQSKKPMMITL